MNRITRIAAVALAVAATGSAFADDITIDTTAYAATKTRAEVQVELAAFKAQRVNPWSSSYNPLVELRTQRSRDDVVAETMAALATGELAAMTGEDSGSAYLAQARQPAATHSARIMASQTLR